MGVAKDASDAADASINADHREIAPIAGPKTSKPGCGRLRGYLEALDMGASRLELHPVKRTTMKSQKSFLGQQYPLPAAFSCGKIEIVLFRRRKSAQIPLHAL